MPIQIPEPNNNTKSYSNKKKPKKSLKQKLFNVLIILGICGSLAYAFQDRIKYVFMQHNINQSIRSLDNELTTNNKERKKVLANGAVNKEYNFDYDSVVPISSDEVYNTYSDDMLGIGLISYPDVEINLPIFFGLDNSNLIYGAGTLNPKQEMGKGNYTLVSHRTDSPNLLFTPLEQSKIGDSVFLKDNEYIYEYRVYNKVRVVPSRTELTDEIPNKIILTLITCNDMYATKRLVVQSEFIKKVKIDSASDSLTDVFKIAKNPLLQF